MELNELELVNALAFAADGMIHAVQPMPLTPRNKKTRAIHHKDTTDDPMVCLTCDAEECDGKTACYKARKKYMEERK